MLCNIYSTTLRFQVYYLSPRKQEHTTNIFFFSGVNFWLNKDVQVICDI